MSLPALFLLILPYECRWERETDVLLVVLDRVVESLEPLVGVPVKLADDADPRFGTTP